MAEIRQRPQVIETNEAQIAVHWREGEYYYPSSKFIGQANLTDPDVLNPVSEEKVSRMFPGIRRSVELESILAHHPRHERSAVLEMVCRRQDQRLLQLRGSAS